MQIFTTILNAIFNIANSHFLALKLVLYTLVVVVLPVVLWNFKVDVLQWALDYLQASGIANGTATITGLGAWLIEQLYLHRLIEIIFFAYSVKLTLRALL